MSCSWRFLHTSGAGFSHIYLTLCLFDLGLKNLLFPETWPKKQGRYVVVGEELIEGA